MEALTTQKSEESFIKNCNILETIFFQERFSFSKRIYDKSALLTGMFTSITVSFYYNQIDFFQRI